MEGRKKGWKTGVTMADVNGDGLLDIYICYSGKFQQDERRNQLFINHGKFVFTEEAKKYGLDDASYSTQAAFFDYDNDGDLDMFLLNHNVKKYDNMQLASFRNQTDEFAGSKLYENKANHFVDVSKAAGIHQYPLTFGLGNFSNGTIPRRQPYPLTEATTNNANYTKAVGNLTGGDIWTSRVWWDK